jgi:hypothetical protein
VVGLLDRQTREQEVLVLLQMVLGRLYTQVGQVRLVRQPFPVEVVVVLVQQERVEVQVELLPERVHPSEEETVEMGEPLRG